MKWSILVGFLVLCLVRKNEGGALKCSSAKDDPSCTTDREKNVPDIPVEVLERAVESECLAGSEWESNCHYCRCSDSGVAECLKQNSCDTGLFGEPIQCKPNTTFARDCNTCTCLDNGLGLCTLDICPKSSIPKKSELTSGKECASGSSWKSQCRQCECNDQGYAVCVDLPCDGQGNDSTMQCAPSTAWKNDCNTCWCTSLGQSMCTRIGCVTSPNFGTDVKETPIEKELSIPVKSRKVRASQEPAKTCQPRQEFRMDCNKCLCDDEGQTFSCTRIDCNAVNNNGGTRTKRETTEKVSTNCEPNSVFKRECNVCQCTQDGQFAVCTLKRCREIALDVENAADTESSSGFRCNAGEQFKRDCNDCTCSADGKSVFCTLRYCDEAIALGI